MCPPFRSPPSLPVLLGQDSVSRTLDATGFPNKIIINNNIINVTVSILYRALDIPPKDKNELNEFLSILDPDDEGYADYSSFVAICALKLHARDQGSETHIRDVDDAFGLFTGTDEDGQPQSSAITLAHLRRVAAVLKEEVDDELLRDMILEANGGAGVGKGVKKGEFEKVMKRAGVWR